MQNATAAFSLRYNDKRKWLIGSVAVPRVRTLHAPVWNVSVRLLPTSTDVTLIQPSRILGL